MAELPIIETPLLQNNNGITSKIYLETSARQVKLAEGKNVEEKIATLQSALGEHSKTYVVDTIADRDTISNPKTGDQVWVKDASSDPTVTIGAAKYIYAGASRGWEKTAEAESMDIVINWNDLEGKPDSSPEEIEQAVAQSHTHTNKATLDKLTENESGELLYDEKPIGQKWGGYVTVGPDDPGFESAVQALNLADGAFFTVITPEEALAIENGKNIAHLRTTIKKRLKQI